MINRDGLCCFVREHFPFIYWNKLHSKPISDDSKENYGSDPDCSANTNSNDTK